MTTKRTRNKALAVLDGQIELTSREHLSAAARESELESILKRLKEAREQVALAYERKAGKSKAPKAIKPSAIYGTDLMTSAT